MAFSQAKVILIPIKRTINFVFKLLFLSLSFSTMPHSKKQTKKMGVRFAYDLYKYHSPPVTPALTSASSIPSSSGPITPPQTSYAPHFPISSIPNFPTKPPRAHPLLESAAFIWDLIEKPTTIVVNNHKISSQLLVEQATNPPLPSHHRSSRGRSTFAHLMGPMWPSRISLTSSIIRCASTSQPMSSFHFTRPIKRGLLVRICNATGDSETSLLTIMSSEVEWSALISSWVVPGFTASPTPAAVQMNGSSTSLDLQLPLLLERQIWHPAFSSSQDLKALSHMLRSKDFVSKCLSSACSPHFTIKWGWISLSTSVSFQRFSVPITYTSGQFFTSPRFATSFPDDTIPWLLFFK